MSDRDQQKTSSVDDLLDEFELGNGVAQTVAIIAAWNAASEIATTVESLHQAGVQKVVVVDDGSTDNTSDAAAKAGGVVLRNRFNRGKGYSVQRGVESSDADYYLLVDADTKASAGEVVELLDPVVAGDADIVIGKLPAAAGRGGFGSVKKLATRGIKKASGFEATAPLSGQRAVRGELLRKLVLEQRFGLEVGMTIDAQRLGARIVEQDVAIEHRHRGRRIKGFVHRGRQGIQIARALYPRLVSKRIRFAAVVALLLIALVGAFAAALRSGDVATSALALNPDASVVVVVGGGWDHFDTSRGLPRGIWGSAVKQRNSNAATADLTDFIDADPMPPVETFGGWSRGVKYVGDWASAFDVAKSGEPVVVIGIPITQASDLGASAVDQVFISALAAGQGEGRLVSSETHRSGFVPWATFSDQLHADSQTLIEFEAMGSQDAAERVKQDALRLDATLNIRHLGVGAVGVVGLLAFITSALVVVRSFHRSTPSTGSKPHGKLEKLAAGSSLLLAAMPTAFLIANPVVSQTQFSLGVAALHGVTSELITVGLVVLGAGLFASIIRKLSTSNWSALRWLMLALIAVVVGDLLTGSQLQFGGVFGSDPTYGRYYGIGNPLAVLLLTATILSIAMAVEVSARKSEALAVGACVFGFVGLAAGLPGLGSDVGSLIVFSVVGLVAAGVFIRRSTSSGVRVRIGIGALVGLGLTVFAARFDMLRPQEQQTHLGRLLDGAGSGESATLMEIALRKIERNIFDYLFPVGPVLLVLAIAVFVALWRTNHFSSLLAKTSTARAGTLAAMGGAITMYAANDSGVVVLALVMVFLIPFVLFQGVKTLEPLEVSEK